jgi:translation initiation factor 2A
MNNLSINPQAQRLQEAPELSVTSPGGGSPNAKKLRGLQKKIRAIEDLEMRLAGGEKLEDTQMKKIGTKAAVQAELDALDA